MNINFSSDGVIAIISSIELNKCYKLWQIVIKFKNKSLLENSHLMILDEAVFN